MPTQLDVLLQMAPKFAATTRRAREAGHLALTARGAPAAAAGRSAGYVSNYRPPRRTTTVKHCLSQKPLDAATDDIVHPIHLAAPTWASQHVLTARVGYSRARCVHTGLRETTQFQARCRGHTTKCLRPREARQRNTTCAVAHPKQRARHNQECNTHCSHATMVGATVRGASRGKARNGPRRAAKATLENTAVVPAPAKLQQL